MHEDAIIKTRINLSLLFQISDVWWRFALIKTRIKEKMKKTQYLLHANITSFTVTHICGPSSSSYNCINQVQLQLVEDLDTGRFMRNLALGMHVQLHFKK